MFITSVNLSGDTISNLRTGLNLTTQADGDYFFFLASHVNLYPPYEPPAGHQWEGLSRSIVTFDTRYLLNRHLLSGQFGLTMSWADAVGITPTLVIEQCFPTDPLNIVAADWSTFDMNVLADTIPYEDISPNLFKNYTRIPYGLGFINQSGGYTAVGTREYKYDFGNTEPVWGNGIGSGAMYFDGGTFNLQLLSEPDTLAATLIHGTNATLNGQLSSTGVVTFQYGLTPSYGQETAQQIGATGTVSQLIGGLSGLTTYHFRIKAVISGTPYYGNDMTFTTAPPQAGSNIGKILKSGVI